MPFTADDLRYRPEQSYPLLYAYLHRNAQRFLGSLKYDAFEVDTVVGHVVEQLVRLGLLGGEDQTSKTALDGLTDAQFYTFLSRSVRNKAIDRLRKRRLQVNTAAELEQFEREESDEDPLEDAVVTAWGTTPFATPEDLALHLASQAQLRNLLKHCIFVLSAAPNQLQAVMQELHEMGADDLLQAVVKELHIDTSTPVETNPHMSQHKDHAHRKLRHCLQQQSTNLTVRVALRLIEYKASAPGKQDSTLAIHTLVHDDLTAEQIRTALRQLVTEGLLEWDGTDAIHVTAAQLKRLARFYREEEE
ncbi:hypothetical protein KSC_074570 [Ktedonobacter sp. SOSP1-52]|uniref:hypothetical protein n=1 Tax=Ktedonobacter sp. SOSP1-52 TaxID=2778366 RepID=UPI001914E5C9|nr:hypothetical protein [Ktedonobacter sp. SOSP1-52]GHO68565.1 hypothetical protein KSC_074570 [Ktedonobacter sp. SOSP1-52]